MSSDLPSDISQFISRSINSVEQLEILLILAADGAQEWTIKPISEKLQSSPTSVEKRLEDLLQQKLVTRQAKDGRVSYRYAPVSADTDALIRRLLELYPTWRFRIIHLIFNKPLDQIRQLADAFRLREEDKDG